MHLPRQVLPRNGVPYLAVGLQAVSDLEDCSLCVFYSIGKKYSIWRSRRTRAKARGSIARASTYEAIICYEFELEREIEPRRSLGSARVTERAIELGEAPVLCEQ